LSSNNSFKCIRHYNFDDENSEDTESILKCIDLLSAEIDKRKSIKSSNLNYKAQIYKQGVINGLEDFRLILMRYWEDKNK
jgi:hypothetical protein